MLPTISALPFVLEFRRLRESLSDGEYFLLIERVRQISCAIRATEMQRRSNG